MEFKALLGTHPSFTPQQPSTSPNCGEKSKSDPRIPAKKRNIGCKLIYLALPFCSYTSESRDDGSFLLLRLTDKRLHYYANRNLQARYCSVASNLCEASFPYYNESKFEYSKAKQVVQLEDWIIQVFWYIFCRLSLI